MERIKEIVSDFIKVPPEQIGPGTPIDRTAVRSSILLHRMYARLAGEGIRFTDYSVIKVFGDLSSGSQAGDAAVQGAAIVSSSAGAASGVPSSAGAVSGVSFAAPSGRAATHPLSRAATPTGGTMETAAIGIDIEEIASLPRTTDFRKEEFYRMNFTPEETAYCILQQDPYASFTGLFAVKEAIVKSGGHPGGRSFDTIRITHSPEGRPMHPGYSISIAHSAGLAIAVAVRAADTLAAKNPAAHGTEQQAAPGGNAIPWVAWVALLMGLAALSIVLSHQG